MNIKSHQADRFAQNPPKDLVAALCYGPDQGLVRERANTIAKSVVPDLGDPFRVAELDEDALASDPARLFDEAAAISMLGGRRVLRVRRAGNALAKLFQSFLQRPSGDALVVLEAGELTKSAALRTAFEQADNAAAVACYPDNTRDLAEIVRAALRAQGLRIAPEALDDAITKLGSDRGITRTEVEKLALYANGKDRIELEEVRAILGDQTEPEIDNLCDAAGEGDLKRLDREFERLLSEGASAISVVRALIGHLQKISLACVQVESGVDIDTLVHRMRPPVHFSRTASFKPQIARWRLPQLQDALDLLFATEILCKTTNVPADAALGRALFSVAAMASMR